MQEQREKKAKEEQEKAEKEALEFVMAVPASEVGKVVAAVEAKGEKAFTIGRVVRGEGVIFKGVHDGSLM